MIFLNPMHAKEPTKIKITSDEEQYCNGELSIKLTDLNKTPISKEMVNITITDSKGNLVVDDVVKTNSKGKAKIDFDLDEGKYDVTVYYCGNENYTEDNTTQKLTIEEEVVEAKLVGSTSQSAETNRYYIDEYHIKQEYADGYKRSVDVRTGEIHSIGF